MRFLIATYAWRAQISGVVHSLEQLSAAARSQGVAIEFLMPKGI
jgi:hypothetical protein